MDFPLATVTFRMAMTVLVCLWTARAVMILLQRMRI